MDIKEVDVKTEFSDMKQMNVKNHMLSDVLASNYFETILLSTSLHQLVCCICENKVALYRIETTPFYSNQFTYKHTVRYTLNEAVEAFKDFWK